MVVGEGADVAEWYLQKAALCRVPRTPILPAMADITITNDDLPELDALLSERIYAFNCAATGIDDGEMLNARILDEAGDLAAAISGHTWGGCCEIVYLWVEKRLRRTGLGGALLRAAEREAIARGCHQIVLSTHDFQAPLFYERFGFQRIATIPNYPRGGEKYIYFKRLADGE
jgi:ribosomal protein S18 acetylase RimI-like enzyme